MYGNVIIELVYFKTTYTILQVLSGLPNGYEQFTYFVKFWERFESILEPCSFFLLPQHFSKYTYIKSMLTI